MIFKVMVAAICALGAVGLVLGGLASVVLVITVKQRPRRDRWGELAQARGLRSAPGKARAWGVVDGMAVCLEGYRERVHRSTTHWGCTRVRVPVPLDLQVSEEDLGKKVRAVFTSPDVQLGDPLDHALHITASDPAKARQVLLHPEVRRRLCAALKKTWNSRVFVQGGWLTLAHQGDPTADFEARLGEALALAHALCLAWEKPWLDLARRWGWTLDGRGAERFRMLAGERDGHSVCVRALPGPDGFVTRVDVELKRPLAGGLLVQLRSEGAGEGLALTDPILARLVRVSCHDPEGARALLAHDEVREALLGVVHGYPGSCLSQDRVTVVVPGMAVEPEAPVQAALGLVNALASFSPSPAASSPPVG